MGSLDWRLGVLVYRMREHPTAIVALLIAGLFLYAKIIELNLLRRIAALLEKRSNIAK